MLSTARHRGSAQSIAVAVLIAIGVCASQVGKAVSPLRLPSLVLPSWATPFSGQFVAEDLSPDRKGYASLPQEARDGQAVIFRASFLAPSLQPSHKHSRLLLASLSQGKNKTRFKKKKQAACSGTEITEVNSVQQACVCVNACTRRPQSLGPCHLSGPWCHGQQCPETSVPLLHQKRHLGNGEGPWGPEP